MEKSLFTKPDRAVLMVSPRDYRLSSLCGYCVPFKENVPIMVPPMVYLEALEIGARPVEAVEPPKVSIDPPPVDASANAKALEMALLAIIARNDPDDLKKDGTPKTNKVVAEMSPDAPRPTSTQILDAYAALQDNLDLAEA